MKKINKVEIERIDDTTKQRYNKRYMEFGIDARTLGWGCKEDQYTRFKAAITYVDFSGKSVLDIGCGFADFYEFFLQHNIKVKKYKGIDLNEQLIEVAKKRFPKNIYEVRNILLHNYNSEQADIVTLFGLLNFKLTTVDNLRYTKEMINAAWKITKETLIVDFLSTIIMTPKMF
jgi:2-polyprenyl-3-methyl-5-hydroxy-6-metoxy-1,4-benzoquinol methylase